MAGKAKRIPAPPIIVCSEWGARKPRAKPRLVGRPVRIIEHHTDGHGKGHATTLAQAREQGILYARSIQNYHMDSNGWNDTGQSFTVMRSGIILQGRWGTVTAIEAGRMVESAHCPGQNDQPGIEHEHLPGEPITPMQADATVWLQAWICDRSGIRPTELYGHGHFYATACPSNLTANIPGLRLDVANVLNKHGRGNPSYSVPSLVRASIRAEVRHGA